MMASTRTLAAASSSSGRGIIGRREQAGEDGGGDDHHALRKPGPDHQLQDVATEITPHQPAAQALDQRHGPV
jgi:hypothetical protein